MILFLEQETTAIIVFGSIHRLCHSNYDLPAARLCDETLVCGLKGRTRFETPFVDFVQSRHGHGHGNFI